MNLIKSLTESKLFSSAASFHRYTGRQLAELCYLHLIGLQIIAHETLTHEQAKQYVLKTNTHDHFKKWHQSSTDLYLLLYSLLANDIKYHDDTTEHFIKSLHIDVSKITGFLSAITSRNSMSDTRIQRLFSTMDNQFKVQDPTLKSIRRLAMNWKDLSLREKKLCFTRLIQIMRSRCQSSDLFANLERVSRKNGLEIADVCDRETGHGCGTPTDDDPTTSLVQIAQLHKSVFEDDGGCAAPAASVATTTADIAPFVKPLGKVRRRPK